MNYDELMTWVGTGYLMHRGFDREGKPINKDRNILNSRAETGSEIEEVLSYNSVFKQYEVLPASATIEAVLDLFNKNRKLLAVIITKTGSTQEYPLGIITTTNIVEMNNILDNY